MEIMTLRQAAEYLSISCEVLRRRARRGEVPSRKLGSQPNSPWRFIKEELEEFVDSGWHDKDGREDETEILLDLMSRYKQASEEEQVEILRKISVYNNEIATGFLCEKLLNKSSTDSILYWSICGLIKQLGTESRNYLEGFLEHKSEWIRILVADFLVTELSDKRALKILKENYKKTGNYLCLGTLLTLEPEHYWIDLKKLAESKVDRERYLALEALRNVDHPELPDVLKKLLCDKDVHVQRKALELIKIRKAQEFTGELEQLLSGSCSSNIKKQAAAVLVELYR